MGLGRLRLGEQSSIVLSGCFTENKKAAVSSNEVYLNQPFGNAGICYKPKILPRQAIQPDSPVDMRWAEKRAPDVEGHLLRNIFLAIFRRSRVLFPG